MKVWIIPPNPGKLGIIIKKSLQFSAKVIYFIGINLKFDVEKTKPGGKL